MTYIKADASDQRSSLGTMADIDEIIGNFAVLDDWDDRYRYLIELGRELPPLAEAAHSDANKVQGCASQVWLDTTVPPDGAGGPVLTFAGDSEGEHSIGLFADQRAAVAAVANFSNDQTKKSTAIKISIV